MVRKKGKAYYYEFMVQKKRYYGVCTNCSTQAEATRFEKKMHQVALSAAAQRTPKAFLENFKDELTGAKPILLNNAFDLYLQKPARREAKPEQIKTNKTYWSDFLAFMSSKHSATTRLSQVTRQQAEAYIMHLRKHGPFKQVITATSAKGKVSTYRTAAEQLSNRTVNKRHKAVKAVFTRLAEDAGLLSNPFDFPTLENDSVSREIFTQKEILLIGDNMTMPYTKPIFTIGFCTGLTLGDICLLRWDEIVDNWITNKRRRKTGSQLEIPILPPLAEFLAEQRRKGVDKASDYVAPELAEMYMKNPSGVQYRIRQFLSSLGIKTEKLREGKRAVSVKSAHAMRHTFACSTSSNGIPLGMAQNILGHMSPEMTLLYQKHSQRQEMERLLNQMPNFFQATENCAHKLLENIEPERVELKHLADTLPIEEIRELLAFQSNSHGTVTAILPPEQTWEVAAEKPGTGSLVFQTETDVVPDLFQWAESNSRIQYMNQPALF